jgi:hypothetical protein
LSRYLPLSGGLCHVQQTWPWWPHSLPLVGVLHHTQPTSTVRASRTRRTANIPIAKTPEKIDSNSSDDVQDDNYVDNKDNKDYNDKNYEDRNTQQNPPVPFSMAVPPQPTLHLLSSQAACPQRMLRRWCSALILRIHNFLFSLKKKHALRRIS